MVNKNAKVPHKQKALFNAFINHSGFDGTNSTVSPSALARSIRFHQAAPSDNLPYGFNLFGNPGEWAPMEGHQNVDADTINESASGDYRSEDLPQQYLDAKRKNRSTKTGNVHTYGHLFKVGGAESAANINDDLTSTGIENMPQRAHGRMLTDPASYGSEIGILSRGHQDKQFIQLSQLHDNEQRFLNHIINNKVFGSGESNNTDLIEVMRDGTKLSVKDPRSGVSFRLNRPGIGQSKDWTVNMRYEGAQPNQSGFPGGKYLHTGFTSKAMPLDTFEQIS